MLERGTGRLWYIIRGKDINYVRLQDSPDVLEVEWGGIAKYLSIVKQYWLIMLPHFTFCQSKENTESERKTRKVET